MSKIGQGDFRRCWEAAGSDGEVLEKFALQFKKLEDAVAAVLEFLGMVPMDGTGTVPPVHIHIHTHTHADDVLFRVPPRLASRTFCTCLVCSWARCLGLWLLSFDKN